MAYIHSKKVNFLFIIYNFKRDRFSALNDVIHVRTSRLLNGDVALRSMSAKLKSKGAGVEKVKISANPDKFITKIFLAI